MRSQMAASISPWVFTGTSETSQSEAADLPGRKVTRCEITWVIKHSILAMHPEAQLFFHQTDLHFSCQMAGRSDRTLSIVLLPWLLSCRPLIPVGQTCSALFEAADGDERKRTPGVSSR